MPKFLIRWNIGHGSDDYDIIDAKDQNAADVEAYQRWLDAADQDYGSEPYTDELFDERELEFYGLERPSKKVENDD